MSGEPEILDWSPEGHPRSRLYGDVYFSAEDGLAESRAVFLQGCGLPDAWAGCDRFTVGELGFGTGLNILALLDLWRRTARPEARLHIFSIEGHPLAADAAARALGAWPELADLTDLLIARWPGRARGFHRVEMPEARAILDLAVMDVEEALTGWAGAADAWFLDGFSPALNPAMWRDEVLDLVARRSAPGARAATFTVAGAVRRGLQAAGFEVEKRPGHGRKRQRLEARLPGETEPPARPRVVVVGAGVAGAATVRALRALGVEPVLIEATSPGAGASGNPAALVTPRLDAGLGPVARLAAQAFARATTVYGQYPDSLIDRGVLQLAGGVADQARFAKIAASDLFEPHSLAVLDAETAATRLGEPAAEAGLDQRTALVVEPAAALAAWTGPILRGEVARLEPRGGAWALLDAEGRVLAEADAVILAAGLGTATLAPEIALVPVRGQASFLDTDERPAAVAWGGYVLPTRTGLLFGATHDRGDLGCETRAADHARNLETLAAVRPGLAARLDPDRLAGRAAIRATTADHLPLVGAAAAAGVFLLTGFGSRGFSWAPLLAEHVAALAVGAPSPLPRDLAALVDPGRFARRAAKRGRNSDVAPS
jgi:tRNA 5-methylaminomethyl-2-thiouridine biosynthesis bifunctional protein